MPAPRIPHSLTPRKSKPDLRRRVQHLAFVRQLPCVACGKAAPSEAAHVRTGTDGGVAVKPGDRYAVPLCAACHAKQHRIGELTFWSALRIDPINGRCGCGRYRRISRPESALCFARDNRSIWLEPDPKAYKAPIIGSKGPLSNPQRPLSLGGENWCSCPLGAVRLRLRRERWTPL